MKKFYSLLVAAAMVLGATSCQQDAIEEVATNEPVSFTATLNNTRTELGEGNKVMWNADDKITIYTQENTAGVVFDGDATEAAATATFTTTSEFAASQTGYLAVYPNTTKAATYADGVWSVPVTIGAEQDMVANGWDEKYNHMVAYSQNNQLAFQAGTALIKFTYEGDAGMFASFYAEGANLAGNATLNYNTADGSINYTTTGTSTNIDLFGLTPGETYYIPIFPGKVEYFHLSGYSSWMPATFYSYEGEFEFKAGKIYTIKAKVQGTPSPWTMMDPNMGTQASMTIDDNGYHVAKAVPAGDFVFYQWDMDNGEQYLSASKELGLNEWQATATDMAIAISIPMDNMFDVYLAPDASMFCLVETGATVPEMPGHTIYFYNADNWTNVHFYCWDANDTHHTGDWPGDAMTKTMVGEVEYYAITLPRKLNDTTLNFIFNDGTGTQTGDLSATLTSDLYFLPNGKRVEDITDPVPAVAYKVYAYNKANWANLYIWCWDAVGSANYTGGTWPGKKVTETATINGYTYYVYEMPVTATNQSVKMLFSNNAGSQTADSEAITLDKDVYMSVNGGTVTLIDDPNNPEVTTTVERSIYVTTTLSWSTMNIYTWSPELKGWPGTAMTKETINGTTWWVLKLSADYDGAKFGGMLFNNGSNQTVDITTGTTLSSDLFFRIETTQSGGKYKVTAVADPRQ